MTATKIFALWRDQDLFIRNRIEVRCQGYLEFRAAGRALQRQLLSREEQAVIPMLECVHAILGEAASTPAEFSADLIDRIDRIGGGVTKVRNVWGSGCARALQGFLDGARLVCGTGNALRKAVGGAISQYGDSTLRFYCHRSSIDAFVAIGATPDQAIVTPDAYRNATAFDVLLKVGSLRSMGFGRVPEAILATPRFKRLVQIAWASEQDEPDFGVSHMAPLGFAIEQHWTLQPATSHCDHPGCSDRRAEPADEADQIIDVDVRTRIQRARGATLQGTVLRLAGAKLLMQRPGSGVVSYSPSLGRVLEKDAEDLAEGDVILRYERNSLDLGPVVTTDAPLIREWRDALRLAYFRNTPLFLGRLRRDGVNLVNLEGAVRAWYSDRRPQQGAHFEIVSRAINWDEQRTRRAWRVLSEQHGAAVQHGLIGAALADEALVLELNSERCRDLLRNFAVSSAGEPLRLRVEVAGTGLEVVAYRVDEVEPSSHIPEKQLDEIIDAQVFSR